MSYPIKRPVGFTIRPLPHIVTPLVLIYGIWPFDWRWDWIDLVILGGVTALLASFLWRDVHGLHYNLTTDCQELRYAVEREARRARRAAAHACLREGCR